MKTNSALAAARERSPERVSATVTVSSSRSPSSSTTCECVQTSIDVVALDLIDEVARHRLAEIAAADQQPALRRLRERNIAAWPAELPPPTITTGSPAQSCASAWVAA